MKKIQTTLLFLLPFLILLSCTCSMKKDETTIEEVKTTNTATVKNTERMASEWKQASLTMVSSGFLFKAKPGTDVTLALQDAINRNKIVYLDTNYIISSSLKIPAGNTLAGVKSATLKADSRRSGLLASRGIYIDLTSRNGVRVEGIKFQPAQNMSNMAQYANAVILINNSSNCVITNNNFDFNFGYSKGMDAVWITGPSSWNNVVSNNYIRTLGITYCEYGASNSTIQNNFLINSSANALGGIGNNKNTPCKDNKLLNNYIENAGRMGIEDQQNVVGTIIRGNTIKGTGKLPGMGAGQGMGISAVAKSTTVESNSISDAKSYYIEVGGRNSSNVRNNEIIDKGRERGIFVNFTGNPTSAATEMTTISGNTITGCLNAIETFGGATPQFVTITSNTIIDPVSYGITLNVGDSQRSSISITQNNIVFNKRTSASRFGIGTYSRIGSGYQNGTYKIERNTFTYKPAVAGGAGYDIAMVVSIDYVSVNYNTVNGYGGKYNVAITNNGAKTKGVKFNGNVVTKAVWDISRFL